MKLTRRTFSLAALAGSAAALTALTDCAILKPGPTPNPPTSMIALLQQIVAAAEGVLATVGTYVGLTAAQVSQIGGYIGSVGSAINAVITALQSGSVLSRVDAVVKALAALATSPAFAALLPAPIALIIAGVAGAIDAFITFLPASPAPAAKRTVSGAEASALKGLQVRAVALSARSLVLKATR